MIVVDASALLEVLLRTSAAETVGRRLLNHATALHAPHLLDLEIAQVLRRYVAAGHLNEERGRGALSHLADFPLERHPHDVLLRRIWALRDNVSAYDAAYVVLAEALGAPLLTRDKRLAAAAERYVQVELV